MIKNGIFGAFAFTGCFIAFVIASQGSPRLVHLVESIFKIVPSIIAVFALIGVIGTILGISIGRFYPKITIGKFSLAIAFVVLAVPLGFVILIYHKASMQVEYPRQELKLADCTSNVTDFHLNAPSGHGYQLQMRMPGIMDSSGGNEMCSYIVSGNLRIVCGGSLLANMPIGSDRSWVDSDVFGLTIVGMQNTNVFPLSKLIQPHKDYEFEIILDSKPPTKASIWMVWWRSMIDN